MTRTVQSCRTDFFRHVWINTSHLHIIWLSRTSLIVVSLTEQHSFPENHHDIDRQTHRPEAWSGIYC